MSYTEFIYRLGDFITDSFAILRAGGNAVNYFLITVGMLMMIWWIGQMIKYKKEAEQTGSIP